MSYIVQRHNRFYVVAYDGLDPLTGRERRRWHPAGFGREDRDARGPAFAPNLATAVLLLLARTVLSQMDVPTRQAPRRPDAIEP